MTFFCRPCSSISPNSEQITGYEIYALDYTPNEREEAETLEDCGSLKTEKNEPVRYRHKYSRLVRLVDWGTSWAATADVRRVETSLTDSQIGSVQMRELDQHHPRLVSGTTGSGEAENGLGAG